VGDGYGVRVGLHARHNEIVLVEFVGSLWGQTLFAMLKIFGG
jgi:hypothetical protein